MSLRSWPQVIAALVIAIAAWAIFARQDPAGLAPRPQEERPTLALLTSLPLIFGESFSLDSGGSPALTRIEQRYNVLPIGVADAGSLAGQRFLLMAHPRAQPAAALVDLDHWVRGGGRLLLLADPRLAWDSSRPIGDALRPPPGFADTGLLAHWGLVLDGAQADGPALSTNGEVTIETVAPGRLRSSGSCLLAGEGFVAHCRIGKGVVTVIADADFLNVGSSEGRAGPVTRNLDLLLDELNRLEQR